MKNTAIIILTLALVFMSYRIIAIENERYALLVGVCENNNAKCLLTVQTRTHWLWHLYYGLIDY